MKITKNQLKRIIREEYTRLKRQGLIAENFDMRSKDLEDSIFEMGRDAIDEVLRKTGYQKVPHKEFIRAWQSSKYPDCWWGNTFIVENLVSMALEKGFSPSNPLTEDRYQLARRITERLREEYDEESDYMKLDLFSITNEEANTY